MDTHLAAVLVFLASGVSAFLWSGHLGLSRERGVRALCGIVLWQLLLLIPFQFLAALQMFGWLARVTLPILAIFQVLVLAASIA